MHYIENLYRTLVILGVLLCLPSNVQGIEKTINTTVGSSFTLSPWSDVKSNFSGFSCVSTFCKAEDNSAFTVNVSTTTSTKYPDYNDLTGNGYYSTYRVQALKAGTYIINGGGTCTKREGYRPSNFYIADPRVVYHVIVTEKPIVTFISIPNSLSLTIGDSYTFSPVITETGASTTLSWNSNNPRVVSVTNNGDIIALTPGTSVITCTASNGVSAQCVVTVNPIFVSNVSLNYQELELEEGKRVTLETTILPANSTNKDIKWSSSNDNVAFVATNGLVIGVSSGYCNITATTTDGSNKSASCIVHVYKLNLTESISFENSSIEIFQGESVILKPIIYPANVSNKVLAWVSSNPSCALVNNDGTVNGLSKGTAIITATTTDGTNLSASCQVVIKNNKFEIIYLIDEEVFKKDSCIYGQEIVLPEVPAKEGYTFGGWRNVPDILPTTDIRIDGKFVANKYEITYKVDQEVFKKDSIEYNSVIKYELYPEKEGYRFSGWSLSSSPNEGGMVDIEDLPGTPIKGNSSNSETPITMPAHDITLYGTFSINTYLITYIIDGIVIKTDSVTFGDAIIVPQIDDKEGYTFSGWGDVVSTMPAKDLTITGSYEINYYQLTYMLDNDIYKAVNIAFGSSIIPIEAPIKTGFIFCGWENLPETMPASDVIVEAMFEIVTGINNIDVEKQYNVYDLMGVKLAESITIEDAKRTFPKGIYIMDGKKIYIRK